MAPPLPISSSDPLPLRLRITNLLPIVRGGAAQDRSKARRNASVWDGLGTRGSQVELFNNIMDVKCGRERERERGRERDPTFFFLCVCRCYVGFMEDKKRAGF